MKLSKKGEIILLVAVLAVFLNFAFFSYGYNKLAVQKKKVVSSIHQLNSNISTEISLYNANLTIFNKIIALKKEITGVEESLILLKTKVRSGIQVSEVIKSLIRKSGINVHNLSLGKIKEEKGKIIYSFDVNVEGHLNNIVRLLENSDSKNELMKVDSYKLEKKDGVHVMEMKISTVYQGETQ